MKKYFLLVVAAIMATMVLTSCSDEDNDVMPAQEVLVTINCEKPEYLKAGDKVALISPSYFTPMENVEKTADVLRS